MPPRLVSGLLMSIACASAASAQPVPPDLHGALIVSSTYRYYASILYGSAAAARGGALAACREDEPRATCAVYASFKNQCVAVAANGAQHIVAIGEHAWDGQRTGDYVLGLCRDKTVSECRLVLTACSTQAQQLQDQGARAGHDRAMPQDFQAQYAGPFDQ